MKNQYQIATTNKTEKRATIAALIAIGYKYSNETCSTVEFVTDSLEHYPVIVVYTHNKTLSGNYQIQKKCGPAITLSDFLKLQVEVVVEVVLNDKYTAQVSKDGINVGCTSFPLSVIDKLVEALNKVERENA